MYRFFITKVMFDNFKSVVLMYFYQLCQKWEFVYQTDFDSNPFQRGFPLQWSPRS